MHYVGIDPGFEGAMVLQHFDGDKHRIVEVYRFKKLEANIWKRNGRNYGHVLDIVELEGKVGEWKIKYNPSFWAIEGVWKGIKLTGQLFFMCCLFHKHNLYTMLMSIQDWKMWAYGKVTSNKKLAVIWFKKSGYDIEFLKVGNKEHEDTAEATIIGRCACHYYLEMKERGLM